MLSPKDPAETIFVVFKFANLVSSIVGTPSVSASYASGPNDPSPSSIVSGSPSVTGTDVTQRIIGGQAGTTYDLRCTITGPSPSPVYVLGARLPVKTAPT